MAIRNYDTISLKGPTLRYNSYCRRYDGIENVTLMQIILKIGLLLRGDGMYYSSYINSQNNIQQ